MILEEVIFHLPLLIHYGEHLEKLNFMPLNNVDYAGGVIITDWYNDIDSNEEIKIALTFLTNEIRLML